MPVKATSASNYGTLYTCTMYIYTSTLITHSALQTKLKLRSSSITKDDRYHNV